MPKGKLSAALKEVQKEYKTKRLELDSQYEKKQKELVKNIIENFSARFEAALHVAKELPLLCRNEVLSVPAVKRFIKQYGTQSKEATNKTTSKVRKSRKSKVSDEQILAFVATERTTEEIKKHFGGWSAPTFNKYLNPLITAKKVSATDTRPKRYKKL